MLHQSPGDYSFKRNFHCKNQPNAIVHKYTKCNPLNLHTPYTPPREVVNGRSEERRVGKECA